MSHDSNQKAIQSEAGIHGLLAEYTSPQSLIVAADKVRRAGYSKWDCYSPFPVHGIDPAMGIKATVLPWIVLCGGLTGLSVATLMQWWMNAVDYPYLISGKPAWSIAANIPVMFEWTILFSAISCVFGMLALNKLPRWSHPLDMVPRFAKVTDDRFFIVVEAADAKFDEKHTRTLLEETGAVALEIVPADNESSDKLPVGIIYALVMLAGLSLVPFGLFSLSRASTSKLPAFHVVPNMDWQPKYKAQRENLFFADGRADRALVEGTVAEGELNDDEHFFAGKGDGGWAARFPESIAITAETATRGEERFGIYCAPCHGVAGLGDGLVHQRAQRNQESAWAPPSNLADERLRNMPVGELFNTISHGIRNMPGYSAQISPADRWAIILHLRSLQRAQGANLNDVPAQQRGNIK